MFVQPLLFALKGTSHVKYEKKKTIDNACFGPRPHPLSFFAGFQWNMLDDLITINNWLESGSSEKSANFYNNGVSMMGHA